ncbi:MAG: homoserine dehydrogenase [Chloroflexi bacterium]|nr:homoserine dehydrogenase [Chloroflexota bacterium]
MEVKPLQLRIGLLGLGTVGSGVAEFVITRAERITRLFDCHLELARALVRDRTKPRPVEIPSSVLTTDPQDVLGDPTIDVVVEVMGGEEPALTYMGAALQAGKHLVTANKEVMAKHGRRLLELAAQHNVDVYYEASVGGGLPLIGPFKRDFVANHISSVRAIINGTTNYILTRMSQGGIDFRDALAEAQRLGYAEADPFNDISGLDAAYKLAILSSLAFHTEVTPDQIYHQGIDTLTARDFRYARELGYAIKLLAIAREHSSGIEARVHPTLVPHQQLLSEVNGVYNAVEIEGDLVGQVLLYGRGAGRFPTASAVAGDLIDLARSIRKGVNNRTQARIEAGNRVLSIQELHTRYYFRLTVSDEPGVLAEIATVFGSLAISIAAFIQQESDSERRTAEIVLLTHRAREASVQEAVRRLRLIARVREIGSLLRIEDGLSDRGA